MKIFSSGSCRLLSCLNNGRDKLIPIHSYNYLGINFLNIIGNFLQNVINLFRPLITGILSLFGYTTGVIIGKSADLATDVAKTGIDITHGTLQSVGDLLINSSQGNINPLAIQQIQSSTGMPNLQQSQQMHAQPQQPPLGG